MTQQPQLDSQPGTHPSTESNRKLKFLSRLLQSSLKAKSLIIGNRKTVRGMVVGSSGLGQNQISGKEKLLKLR
jgi:hypothetical protein